MTGDSSIDNFSYIKIQKKAYIDFFISLYVGISLFLFAFMNFKESTIFNDYVVFFINGAVVSVHFLITILFFCGWLIYKLITHDKIKFNLVSICLLLKTLLDFLSFAINGDMSFSEYYEFWIGDISSFVAFFIISNSYLKNGTIKIIKFMFIVFSFVLATQVIFTFFLNEINFNDSNYKLFLNIPYGGSNVIISGLIPGFVIAFFILKSKLIKIMYMLYIFIAVFLTKSRGGIVLFSFLLYFLLFVYGCNKHTLIKRIVLLFTLLISIILIILNDNLNDIFIGFFQGKDMVDLNSVSSGRINLWTHIIFEVDSKYYLFGTGMKSIYGNVTGVHNLLIDLFIKCGIIGAIIYIFMFFNIIKKISISRKNGHYSLFLVIIFIYINSLFEVCYFFYKYDTLLWIIIGLLYCESYNFASLKSNECGE